MTVSFRLYDLDGDGFITPDELMKLFKDVMRSSYSHISDEELQRIVAATFEECDVNKDGKIDYNEYLRMAKKRPRVLHSMIIKPSEHGELLVTAAPP
jgi:Ca2+-binding EF-hand superfamily protein